MSVLTDGLKRRAAAKRGAPRPGPAAPPRKSYQTHVREYLDSLNLGIGDPAAMGQVGAEIRAMNKKLEEKESAMAESGGRKPTAPSPGFDPTVKQPWMDSTPQKQCLGPCGKFKDYVCFKKDARFKDDGYSPVCLECAPRWAAAGGSKADLSRINAAEPALGGSFRRRRSNPERKRAYRMVVAAASRAARQGVACDLHGFMAELESRLAGGKCEMTGMKWDYDTPLAFNTPSLYAVDPAKGFVYHNVKVICWGMNCALGTWGPEVLKSAILDWMAKEEV